MGKKKRQKGAAARQKKAFGANGGVREKKRRARERERERELERDALN